MPKCKNCENYNCNNETCEKFCYKLGEQEIYINVGLCDEYIPTIDYILSEKDKIDENYF